MFVFSFFCDSERKAHSTSHAERDRQRSLASRKEGDMQINIDNMNFIFKVSGLVAIPGRSRQRAERFTLQCRPFTSPSSLLSKAATLGPLRIAREPSAGLDVFLNKCLDSSNSVILRGDSFQVKNLVDGLQCHVAMESYLVFEVHSESRNTNKGTSIESTGSISDEDTSLLLKLSEEGTYTLFTTFHPTRLDDILIPEVLEYPLVGTKSETSKSTNCSFVDVVGTFSNGGKQRPPFLLVLIIDRCDFVSDVFESLSR